MDVEPSLLNSYQLTIKQDACSTLQEITTSKLADMVNSFKPNNPREVVKFMKSVKNLREYFSKLQINARAHLLQETLNNTETWDPEGYPQDLYTAQVLFVSGCKELDITLEYITNQMHFNILLRLLKEEGENLDILKINFLSTKVNSANVQESFGYLTDAFTVLKHLTTLSLVRICTDEMLKLVAMHCNKLQSLDISESYVTNLGLHFLTQTVEPIDLQQNEGNAVRGSILQEMPDIFLHLRTFVPPGESEVKWVRRKTPLCETLKRMEMTISKDITFKGLLTVLASTSNFEQFDMDLKPFFTDVSTYWNAFTVDTRTGFLRSLSLTSIFCSSVTERLVKLINTTCPKLRSFAYEKFDPSHEHLTEDDVFVLGDLSEDLDPNLFEEELEDPDSETLEGWQSVPLSTFNSFNCLEELHIYDDNSNYVDDDVSKLSTERKASLKNLTLWDMSAATAFRLETIFQSCPNLETLKLKSKTFDWNDTQNKTTSSLESLKCVYLAGEVTTKALIEVLSRAPNLETIHLRKISDKPVDFVGRLCNIAVIPKLKEIFFSRGYFVEDEDELEYFTSTYSTIRLVGILPFKPERFVGEVSGGEF